MAERETKDMRMREDILIVKGDGYFFVDTLDREPKHRAETAFRRWLEARGKDGQTYILAKWLSHEMTINVKRTIVSSEAVDVAEQFEDPEAESPVNEAAFHGEAEPPGESQEEFNERASEATEEVTARQEEEPDGFPGQF